MSVIRFSRLLVSVILLLPSALVSVPANAAIDQGVAVNYVHGEDDINGVKLAYQLYMDTLRPIHPDLEMVLETSVNFWEYGNPSTHDTDYVVAASPILRFPIAHSKWVDTYVEGGVGVALMNDTVFAGKNVGIHFQFEDRLGLAFRVGQERKDTISLTYLHYSNAGLSKHNPGIDLVNLAYSHKF